MTLRCKCGSYALDIVNQNYSDSFAFEKYECEHCGRTGSLTVEDTARPRPRYGGCVESDFE